MSDEERRDNARDIQELARCWQIEKHKLQAERDRLQKQVSDITSMWTEMCEEASRYRAALESIYRVTNDRHVLKLLRDALSGGCE